MSKLAAILTVAFYSFTSSAFAAEDAQSHGEEATSHAATESHAGDAHHGAEHASSGGLPQFDPTWFPSQIFWLAISFAFLYFFFAKKTLPDISGVIENRKNHIQSDLDTAEKLTAEADAVHDAYQENLTQAQSAAAQAIQDVENDMKERFADAFEEFRQRSEEEIQEAEDRINTSKNAAMNDMNTIAAEAAAQAVEKIIGTKTDVNQVKAVVENLNGVGKAKAA